MRIPDYELADMHIHIMPEVDDGSESMEMTMEMLSVFTLLKDAIAKGGSTNMLTGVLQRF